MDAWKPFAPHLEPVIARAMPLNDGFRPAIAALLARGIRPVSINSYLTCVRAYMNWLYANGHLAEKPRVPLLKCEDKIITALSPEQLQRVIRASAPCGYFVQIGCHGAMARDSVFFWRSSHMHQRLPQE